MISNTFLKYITRTPNVCIYQFGNQKISPTLQFPHARTVTLINCSREGVNRILTPSIFPNMREVHYLSAHPGQVDIYQRFSRPISWIFPNSDYIFYKCMIEAGWGRVENRLISTYVHSVEQDHNQIYMDLSLPHYGTTIGEPYRERLHHYLRYQQYPLTSELEHDYLHGEPEPFDCQDDIRPLFLQDYTDSIFFNAIMEECEKEEIAIKNKIL
jgi:hypothetical protein